MNNKVILIILDGLNYQVARQCMGYLQGLIEHQQASFFKLSCELPSLSRPLYECLLTGVRPIDSGIVHNHIVRLSHHDSIFSLAKQQGKVTAASAYHWMSELYNRAPFEAARDRNTHDTSLNIQHGRFYHWDHYPDEAVLLDANDLIKAHQPDFMLIHPMNIDDAGHQSGLDSAHYRNTARQADILLSNFLPDWLHAGYQIMITSDHGMNNDLSHGGTLAEEREVPLFLLGPAFQGDQVTESNPFAIEINQTDLCGTLCQVLGLKHDKPYCAALLNPEYLSVSNSPSHSVT